MEPVAPDLEPLPDPPAADQPEPHPDPGLRRRAARRVMPQTFQGRLTLAFVAILALTLSLVTVLVLNRLGDYFDQQQREDLTARSFGVAQYVALVAESASGGGLRPVVDPVGVVDPGAAVELRRTSQQRILADYLGKADVRIRLGTVLGRTFTPASNGEFVALLETEERPGQTREPITSTPIYYTVPGFPGYVVEVTLSNPYTYRAAAIATTTGLLAVIGIVALAVSVVAAAALARRFTTPLRRLTEASRDLAEGDLARRVPQDALDAGSSELAELAFQFNAMADRVQNSVEIIRRDRDRSRDFLADVSHELRTPIAALRTFNELLRERAGEDPAARTEFLEASGVQLERLDWLAQNLLDLSKLDSGLVLLDLRPDDLRSTVEQAIEQAEPAAKRRGLSLVLRMPEHPLRIRHDPVRFGQVVANLVGNAVKFTPRDGQISVIVEAVQDGARVVVTDTGVGIDADELPRIFERFYRGTRANEARGSGSGLGLAIVRSIVDMHGGTVTVESRLNAGTTFAVTLPRDPRAATASTATASAATANATPTPAASAPAASTPAASTPAGVGGGPPFVADSSSSEGSRLNVEEPA
ncbi:MAG: HAMP domain-containing histidine kinase [Chloroflexi bacterium]|nr:HAMP domain-containing histidine kinase [Chloroflexota bacterium]